MSAGGITRGEIRGWESVTIAGPSLSVTVLPGKGADIYSIVDGRTGVDVLFKAPWGLGPPGSVPREGSGGMPFLENYEGGWQELFPNAGDPCVHRGRELPFHGEVATLPWTWRELEAGGGGAAEFTAVCRVSPLRLVRVLRVAGDRAQMTLDETVINLSDEAEQFVWGHHCVLGPPLIAEGARLHAPCRSIVTIDEAWEETARLETGQRSRWPMARLRDGGEVDLSQIPGPAAGSHDDVYLGDLAGGWLQVDNAAIGLGFRVEWDPAVFPWIISWQPYGGARAMPLAGAFALGVEPWVSRGNLSQAVAEGEAIQLAAGASMRTTITATITVP